MWFNNPRNKMVKRRSVFKILNVHENIDGNLFSHSREIVELVDMR